MSYCAHSVLSGQTYCVMMSATALRCKRN